MSTSYADKLKDPRWQKKRLKVFEHANFTCENCSSKERTLNVHHKRYIRGREPWQYDDEDLSCLCEDCHQRVSTVGKILNGHHESSEVKVALELFKGALALQFSDSPDPADIAASLCFLSDVIGYIDLPSRLELDISTVEEMSYLLMDDLRKSSKSRRAVNA